MQDKIIHYGKMTIPLIKRYAVFMILAVVAGMTMLAINRISAATGTERNEDYYNELFTQIRVINFDEDTIQAIRSLNDPNTSIRSNFPENRNNPF